MPEGEMDVDRSLRRLQNKEEDAMEEEDTSSSNNPLGENIVIQPKFKMPKIDPIKLQKLHDKARDKDGNIRLGRVQKLYKKSLKKQRKLGNPIFRLR